MRQSTDLITLATPPTTFSTKILTNDLIFDLIFCFSSPGSLVCLERTCMQLQAAVKSYFRRTFNINRHFSRFFDNPQDFRSLQARTATLVSGSNALQFFSRITYEDSDLDLYVYYKHRLEVGHWLIQNGYTYKPNAVQNTNFDLASKECTLNGSQADEPLKYHMKGVASVFTFTKPCGDDASKELKVQAVVVSNAPMEVILNFHSTIVFNVISWDRAYSLYPRATFEDHRGLWLRPDYADDEGETDIIKKYRLRGWKFEWERGALDGDDPAFGDAARWIGDTQSWVIKLDTHGVTRPPPVNEFSQPLTRDPCCMTSWWMTLAGSGGPHEPPTAAIDFVFSYPTLSYKYASLYGPWRQAISIGFAGLRKDEPLRRIH
ncbi:hypothetical protein BDY19DRAFT_892207 [Irpex rosettiformis]|uniref:Uncharacterized protein n=1 Tax=Irpex rosettiformis TaxID=378272 RepID=A0ACB8U063_9APHY|nr:hypothetical protein BDY19DRAFT_892207 [Irpex rosettiformis]